MESLENVMDKLIEFREIVKNLINTACHGALLVEGFSINDNKTNSSLGVLLKTTDTNLKMSYTEQANKRRVCERLAKYV